MMAKSLKKRFRVVEDAIIQHQRRQEQEKVAALMLLSTHAERLAIIRIGERMERLGPTKVHPDDIASFNSIVTGLEERQAAGMTGPPLEEELDEEAAEAQFRETEELLRAYESFPSA